MDPQRKIFAYLLVFISTALFSSIFVDANFDEERKCLGKFFVWYFRNLNSWCTHRNPWPEDQRPIQNYEKALEENESSSSIQLRRKKKISDFKKFEETTKNYLNEIEGILKGRIRFGKEPITKTKAIIDLCIWIKKECYPGKHTVNIPLADDLEKIFTLSYEHVQENKEYYISAFAEHCKPAQSNDVGPADIPPAIMEE